MRQELSDSIRKLISRAVREGHVSYDALNAAMPLNDYTPEEIEEVEAVLSSKGIALAGGMKFYEAVWKRDGQEIFRMHMHAIDETTFMEKALAHIAEYPIADGLEGTTVEIGFGESRPAPYQPEDESGAAAADAPVWQVQDQQWLNDILDLLTRRPTLPTED